VISHNRGGKTLANAARRVLIFPSTAPNLLLRYFPSSFNTLLSLHHPLVIVSLFPLPSPIITVRLSATLDSSRPCPSGESTYTSGMIVDVADQQRGPFSFDRKEPEPKSLDSSGFYSSSGSYSSPASSNGSRSRSGRLGIVRPSSVLGTKRSGFYARPSSPSKRLPSTNSQSSQRALARPMSRFPRCPTPGSSAHVDLLYEVPEDSDNPYEYDSSTEYESHPSNLPSTDTTLALTRHVHGKPATEPRGPFVTPEDSKYPRFTTRLRPCSSRSARPAGPNSRLSLRLCGRARGTTRRSSR